MRKYLVILLVAALAIFGAYVPQANAADGITPYVNYQSWTGWDHRSKEIMGANGKADYDFTHNLVGTGATNMGLNAEKNNVKMKAELGPRGTQWDGANNIRIRHFYITYKIGEVEMLCGQTGSPYANPNPNDVANGDIMVTSGTSFDYWTQQLRFTAFGAYINIMRPVTYLIVGSNYPGPAPAAATYGYPASNNNLDYVYPKLAAGYTFKTDMFSIAANGVFQQLKYDDKATGGASTMDGAKLTSYLVNFIFKGNFGPASVNVSGFYGQNIGNMGFFSCNGGTSGAPNYSNFARANATTDGYENTKSMGGNVGAGFKVGIAKIDVGVGYESDKNDMYTTAKSKKDDSLTYFVACAFAVEQNFWIVPEVKQYDFRKNLAGNKEGKLTNIGFAVKAAL